MAENNKAKQVRKGKTNNPHGRPRGTPNKATTDARKAIALFVEENAHRLTGWLDQVAEGVRDPNDESKMLLKADPAKAFEMFQTVVEYHIPKLARTEHTGEDGKAIKFEVVAPWLKDNIARRN